MEIECPTKVCSRKVNIPDALSQTCIQDDVSCNICSVTKCNTSVIITDKDYCWVWHCQPKTDYETIIFAGELIFKPNKLVHT